MADETVATGISSLDAFLRGGLPKGYTALLLDPSSGGAEIFAKQFAASAGKAKVVYVSTDESAGDVQAAATAAKMPFEGIEILDLQTEFAHSGAGGEAKSTQPAPVAPRPVFDARSLMEGASSLDFLKAPRVTAGVKGGSSDYLTRMIQLYTRLSAPDRLVVQSLDFFLNQYPLEHVCSALATLKAATARQGGIALWVLAKGAYTVATERRLEALADCLMELEVTRVGKSFDRHFVIKKVKNRGFGIGAGTYDITEDGFKLGDINRVG